MAVSGRKLSDFRGSLSLGSTEDFDICCEPCLTTGQHKEAHRYCLVCQEYLCKNCSDCHLKTKASRNHRLVDKDTVGQQSTTIKDFETCTEHKQEAIKFYCPRHEALSCHDCVVMRHRTCDIDYIPDKCAGMADTAEYRQTIQKLDQKLQELDDITKNAKVRDKEIDACHANLIKEIVKFRKEINDQLDQLQQKIQNEADNQKTTEKQIIQSILDGCNSLSSDIKELQSRLHANKTSDQQLYITVKQAQSVFKSGEIKEYEDGFKKTSSQYTFERESSLETLLAKPGVLGKLSFASALNTPRKEKHTYKLSHIHNINLESELGSEWATGSTVLSSDKLVLTDYDHRTLKVVDIQRNKVVEEISVDAAPWDVTTLSQNQFAVTMPGSRHIVIMAYRDRLSTVRKIPVEGECKGIAYQQNHLYVVCVNLSCVFVLDMHGNMQNKISLDRGIFREPHYLALSKNSKCIYISDNLKNSVFSLTLQGEVRAIYKHNELTGPKGLLMLEDGSLLVCCSENLTIHYIEKDLKQGQTIVSGLNPYPFTICYAEDQHKIFVGGYHGYHLKVFRLE